MLLFALCRILADARSVGLILGPVGSRHYELHSMQHFSLESFWCYHWKTIHCEVDWRSDVSWLANDLSSIQLASVLAAQ